MSRAEVHGLLLCDDLILASKVRATAAAQGLIVRVIRRVEELVDACGPATRALLLELDHSDFAIAELLSRLAHRPRVVAYGPHVHAGRLQEARRAGCDIVLTRGQFVEQLESQLANWLSA